MALRFVADTSPFLIAGPCVVEGDDLNVRVGEALAELAVKLGISVIYKASYDKANRSRLDAPRGTFFGYGDLVVDMRSFSRLRAACHAPVIFDATHSVQQPGQGRDGATGGERGFIPPLLYAAAAAGADGFFLETHPDPAHAPSDGPNMIPLDQLAGIVSLAVEVWHRVREPVGA